jgi:predicted small lipoprotein YifL
MNACRDSLFLRFAMTAALAASLGVAACGRKGPLDPPPGSSLEGVRQPDMPSLISTPATPIGGQAKDGEAGVGTDGRPVAAKGPKKQIPLDVLLN